MSDTQAMRKSAGLLSDGQIRNQPKRVSRDVIERFERLQDLAGTVADALDLLGLSGVIGASTLPPTLLGKRAVGTAITLRNVGQTLDPHVALTRDDNRMAEIEAIHQAAPGDILVIQGVPNVSNMGGIIATICVRQKLSGAVVDGGVRDVQTSRALGFPIWSRHITPLTGKWRAISTEVNGTISVAGVTVSAGDLVVSDETGICVVPHDSVDEILRLCEIVDQKESGWLENVGNGMAIPDVIKHLYKKPGRA